MQKWYCLSTITMGIKGESGLSQNLEIERLPAL